MEYILKELLNKEIEVFYWTGEKEQSAKGILKECHNGWIKLESKGKAQCFTITICRRLEEK